MNVPVIWVNRHGEKLEGRKAPDRRGQELPRRGEEARRRRLTRARTSRDPADEAMVARARERFAAERRAAGAPARRAERDGALPNLIVIGGLKCGTTSLHHYLNLHPEVAMSRPKELNFFVEELNWELGARLVREPLRPRRPGPRRELAALHQPAALRGRRRADARAARRRADRLHGPRPDRPHALALRPQRRRRLRDRAARARRSAIPRARLRRARAATRCSSSPTCEAFGRERDGSSRSEELRDDRAATMRRMFEFLGVDPSFPRTQFEREWETGSAAKPGGLPADGPGRAAAGAASLRPQLRPPARSRFAGGSSGWSTTPTPGAAPKPELPDALRERLVELLSRRRQAARGDRRTVEFGWLQLGLRP